jgi:hypothetical protein
MPTTTVNAHIRLGSGTAGQTEWLGDADRPQPVTAYRIVASARLGGLHHHYRLESVAA